MRSLPAPEECRLHILRVADVARGLTRQEGGTVPCVRKALLDHAREPHLLGAGAPVGERRGHTRERGAYAAGGRALDCERLVKSLEQDIARRATHGDARTLPGLPLGVAQQAGALGEGKHCAHAAVDRPCTQLGESRYRLPLEQEGRLAVVRPGGERPTAVARDEHGVARPAQRPRTRERVVHIAVEHQHAAVGSGHGARSRSDTTPYRVALAVSRSPLDRITEVRTQGNSVL